MSLINDALKRAEEAQQKTPPGGPSLAPVEFPSRTGAGRFLPLLVILLLATACFFLGLAMAKRPLTRIVNRPETTAPQPVGPVSSPVAAAPAVVSETSVAAGSNSTPVPSIPAPPPPPKLQGIVYDPVRPWAIVDGRTVYPGSHVGNFRVKEISKDTVTLEGADGSRQKLVLGR
jgi:hypothetical protein